MLGFGSQKRTGIQNMLYKQKKHELRWRSSLVAVTLHNRMLYFNRFTRKPSQAASCTINPPLETSTGSDLGFIMIPGAQVPTSFQEQTQIVAKKLSDSWAAICSTGCRDTKTPPWSSSLDRCHLRLARKLPEPDRDCRSRGRLCEQGARPGVARQRLHGRPQPWRHHVGDLDRRQPRPRCR